MNNPGQELPEEPQSERGEPGSRDTGSDQPSGGPVDRPEGAVDDPRVPSHGSPGDSGTSYGGTGMMPPQDSEPALPPYEGRKESGDITSEQAGEGTGTRTAGAARQVADSDYNYKAPKPGETPGGATASPADEQPASQSSERDRDHDPAGPAHMAGTGRAEDKL
jgi:hypothetical protein